MQTLGTAKTTANGRMYGGNIEGEKTASTITMASEAVTSFYEVTITASTDLSGAVDISIGSAYLGDPNSNGYCKLYTSTSGTTTALTPSFNNGKLLLTSHASTSRRLQYNANATGLWFAFYAGTQQDLVIYKKDTSSSATNLTASVKSDLIYVIQDQMTYVSDHYELALCDSSGDTFDNSKWSAMAASFTSSLISKYHLANAHANKDGNMIERFLAAYDYVIGHKKPLGGDWASANDFLGRFEAGGINALSNNGISNQSIANNGLLPLTIVIISSISLVGLLGACLLIRRRKEEK